MYAIILYLIIWLPLVALNGWAISILWTWFVVPLFELPTLTIGQAIGLALVIHAMTNKAGSSTIREPDTNAMKMVVQATLAQLFKPFIIVGGGWVYLQVFF